MKTKNLFVLLMVLMMSAPVAFSSNAKSEATAPKVENKLSAEEVSSMKSRVEEIRDMDKSNMTVKEKRELKKELKEANENIRRSDGYIYIGTGTLLLIILLIILL